MTQQQPSPALAQLLRWELSGATWRLERFSAGSAVVSLCRCDGGEEVDTLVSDAPDLVAYVLDASGEG